MRQWTAGEVSMLLESGIPLPSDAKVRVIDRELGEYLILGWHGQEYKGAPQRFCLIIMDEANAEGSDQIVNWGMAELNRQIQSHMTANEPFWFSDATAGAYAKEFEIEWNGDFVQFTL